ncbi:MAG: hypothetical protein AAF483_04385 [Planctomycetota bacterium]
MRYSLLSFLITTALIGVLLAVSAMALRSFLYGIDDGYALGGAAEMVMGYMDDNSGKWPPNWEVLRTRFEQGGSRVGGWSFEKFKSRIWIDFQADPAELRRLSAESGKPSFNVIGTTHNTGVYVGDDANTRLWKYFRSASEP